MDVPTRPDPRLAGTVGRRLIRDRPAAYEPTIRITERRFPGRRLPEMVLLRWCGLNRVQLFWRDWLSYGFRMG